ncbi:Autoinducer 2 sensor kinase/phosphatase LuxQ [Eubacterium plexicaudatum ASF492]|nr:Autoinducer 2 sensor kinase/phosphatase LuxQ [Eubacterium plexicaudatum ASF492]
MTSGNHLLSLINDVLDMSRIESGRMNLDEKPCCLPDILHGLRNMLQADIHAKRLDLYMDAVDIMHEEIYCDKLRLNQVLLNLLGNAVKYTGAGGMISMRITEKPASADECAVYEFTIRDTGFGMSNDFVAHIFEPFEREKNSTISGIQGTGLGMAITKILWT